MQFIEGIELLVEIIQNCNLLFTKFTKLFYEKTEIQLTINNNSNYNQ